MGPIASSLFGLATGLAIVMVFYHIREWYLNRQWKKRIKQDEKKMEEILQRLKEDQYD